MPTSTTSTITDYTKVDALNANDELLLYDASTSTYKKVESSTIYTASDVTLAGSYDYLTLSGQEITLGQVDLTTDVTGLLPVGNIVSTTNASSTTFLRGDGSWAAPSGSGDMLAATYDPTNVEGDAFDMANMVEAANAKILTSSERSKLSGIEDGADVTDTANVTASGALMDSEVDENIKTLSLPANTTISAFGASLVDDASAAAARTTLDVDQAGTDNSTPVTLAGSLDYLTLSGQEITRNAIDLSTDVTGFLPVDNIVTSTNASSTTFLRGDGSWSVPAGSGDVSKVGTPLNDQVGVWTGDGTIEGTSGLTYDGSALSITGNITVSGTVDGRDIATDGSKLDGIEANADVTDTDNVRSAGALMDDEVTNLADVKAFDPANYATAAQGTKADSALQDLVDDTTPQLGGDLDLNGNKILSLPCEIGIACSDETTALTTGTAKATFRMPYAMTLTAVRASLTGAGSTSGTTTIDINESGTTVLSTKLTIDAGEKTSTTAATPAVISDSALADDAEITIDIDAVSGGADETGLKVWLIGTRA